MVAYYYEGESGKDVVVKEIPDNLKEEAKARRTELIEGLANEDPVIEELYFDEKEITAEVLQESLRRNTIANKIVPVFMGSAYKNKGVQ